MFTIFRYAFTRFRGQILGWGLSLALLGAVVVGLFDMMQAREEQYTKLFASFPKEFMAFFNASDMSTMFTPSGFINLEFFSYMTIIIGIFAVMNGSGLLAGDEEGGVLDLILGYPISRRRLFFERLAAFIAAMMAVLVITWLGFVVIEPGTQMNVSPDRMGLPFISLFGVLMLFGCLALVLSMLLPSRRMAAMTSGILMVASFFITALAQLDSRLESLARLSPLNYYQGGLAIDGLNWGWMGGLLGVSLLFVLVAWWRFERRDIRVVGEGSWRLPGFLHMQKRQAQTGNRV
jgi:ABC-2 type transport system permease protein